MGQSTALALTALLKKAFQNLTAFFCQHTALSLSLVIDLLVGK
jgi:hypothetical protein